MAGGWRLIQDKDGDEEYLQVDNAHVKSVIASFSIITKPNLQCQGKLNHG